MFDDLDALDEELLAHFGARFPKPTSISFSDYDVDPENALLLCSDQRLYANDKLIRTFVVHNRLGMFGDWRDFPAFVGDIAVYCRREPMMLQGDHGFFFLHLAEGGAFDGEDRALLRRWVEDILMPWERALERGPMLHWYLHAWNYLGLLIELGGDVHEVLERNLERSRFVGVTELARRLTDSPADEEALREQFAWLTMIDNQTPPIRRFVRPALVDEVLQAIRTFTVSIPAAPRAPIDEAALYQDLDDGCDPTRVEHALIALEGARWHRPDYEYWQPTQPFPWPCFDAFDVAPVRLVEAYLSITEDYRQYQGDWNDGQIRWSQVQAVFVHGDGRAGSSLAACVRKEEYGCAEALLREIVDDEVLGEADHPCRATRVAGMLALMRRLLSASEWSRRDCIDAMRLWSDPLRADVGQPLLELLGDDERGVIDEFWADEPE